MGDGPLELPKYLTAAEVAKMLHVSLPTVWRWSHGILKPVHFGRTVRWRLDSILEIRDGKKESAAGAA